MTTVNEQGPYYDTYNKEKSSGYDKLNFNPGRILQSREANVLQSMLQDQLKGLGDSIYSNGTPLQGLNFNYDRDKGIANIGPGLIYLDGLVKSTNGGTVNITGIGQETINARTINTLVKDDDEFRDPAVGYENENKYGADRNQASVTFTSNDLGAPVVYTLIDGEVISSSKVDQIRQLVADMIASNTYNQSGNYRISGLSITEPSTYSQDDADRIKLKLSAGEASIKGYDVTKVDDSPFYVDRAKTTSNAINEVKIYKSGTLRYLLNTQWVRNINKVTIQTRITVSITRGGTSGGTDLLDTDTDDNSVIEVITIKDNNRTYVQDNDFMFNPNNSSVSWAVKNGNQPSTGSTYTVDMVISKVLSSDEYSLDNSDSVKGYLVFKSGSDKPYIDGKSYAGQFSVEYTYMLPRIDIVSVDSKGLIQIIKGTPSSVENLSTPERYAPDTISLAAVLITPNSSNVRILMSPKVRLTMDDLYIMYQELSNSIDNQAITNLDRAAKDGEDATLLSGIFTDAFSSITKADMSHKDFHGSYDTSSNEFTSGTNPIYNSLVLDDNNKSNNYQKLGAYLTAPRLSSKKMLQAVATDTVQVNEYNVFQTDGIVDLEPAQDTWVDTTTNNVQKNVKYIYDSNPSWGRSEWWYTNDGGPDNSYNEGGSDSNAYYSTVYNSWVSNNGNYDGPGRWDAGFDYDRNHYNTGSGQTSTSTVVANTVTDEIETMMRPIKVMIHGTNFVPDSDNYAATFGDQSIALTAESETLPGTKAGTIRTDSQGKFNASFMVPSNYPSGTATVEISNDKSSGTAQYYSEGIHRTKTYLEDVTTTIHRKWLYDPVSETFSTTQQAPLEGVSLFFSTKDSSLPIIVQLKSTTNHLPDDNVLSEKVVYPSDISTSADGSSETVVTFDNSVTLEANTDYAIVVLSDSNKYNLFIGTLGHTILGTTKMLATQPYTNGTLFTSANGTVWSESQSSDLKFGIITDSFTSDGRALFKSIHSNDGFNRIMPMITTSKDATGVTIQYSIDNGSTWQNLSNNNITTLSTKVDDVLVQVLLDSKSASPIIEWDNAAVVTYLDDNKLSYVSRNVQYDTKYTAVKVTLNTNYDQSTSLINQHIYYASDTDGNTWTELPITNKKLINSNLNSISYEYTCEKGSLPSGNNFRVKVVLDGGANTRPRISSLRTVTRI